jgi:hypothetical protein
VTIDKAHGVRIDGNRWHELHVHKKYYTSLFTLTIATMHVHVRASVQMRGTFYVLSTHVWGMIEVELADCACQYEYACVDQVFYVLTLVCIFFYRLLPPLFSPTCSVLLSLARRNNRKVTHNTVGHQQLVESQNTRQKSCHWRSSMQGRRSGSCPYKPIHTTN